MTTTSSTTEIIDAALESYANETSVPKLTLINVLLDVRNATEDPAVTAAADTELGQIKSPTIVLGNDARGALRRVRDIAAASPALTPA